jgi:hypothetical protein
MSEKAKLDEGIKHVGYILHSQNELAEKLLLKGEQNGEYYDGKHGEDFELEHDEFKWNGQTREITEAGTFVDGDKLVSGWIDSSKEPIEYKSPNKFSASDLKILRREETTKEGVQNAVGGTGGGFGSSRAKSILIVAGIAIAIFALFILLPKYVPALQKIPIFGW